VYTSACLSDLHARTHQSLQKLLDHCGGFSPEELDRELEGFGGANLLLEFDHLIGAERYWVGVLQGRMLVEGDPADRASLATLGTYRERVAGTTTAYLNAATDAELNTRRTMTTWGDKEVDLVPAHVLLRTQTHIFQHQGKIAVMCRLLDRPIPPGLDFPLG
jgi:uncharacterized damage-inducible protein DinB